MSKRIAEGSSCKGAEKGYLKVSWDGNEQFTYYTSHPPFHWHVNKVVENIPQGQYWVAISYSNTALKFPNYACGQNKFANIYRTETDGVYCKVKGKILGIIFDKKRYESVATYKLQVENIQGRIFDLLLTENFYGSNALISNSICDPRKIASAYPNSVKINDVIPITGGYTYQLIIIDDKGEFFEKTLPKEPTVDDYCVYPKLECPPGTCSHDCNPLDIYRKITEQNKLKTNQALVDIGKANAEIKSINMQMLTYDKQIKAQNKRIEENDKIVKANQRKIKISEAKVEQQNKNIDKKNEAIIQDIKQSENKVKSEINTAKKKIEDVNNKNKQLEQRVIQSDIRITEIITGQKGLSDALKTAKLPEIIKELDKVIDEKIAKNTRIRKLGDKVTVYDKDISSLKSSQINLKSSLDGTNTKLKEGLEVNSRLGDGDITKLKSNQDNFRYEQTNLKSEVDNLKRTNLNEVNNKQVAEINSKLDKIDSNVSKFPSPSTIALAVGSLDIFRQILNKKNPISPCQAPALVPPVAAQVKANGVATAGFRIASLGQGTLIQQTTSTTKNIVEHSKHGLEAVQKATDIARKATHADKALQMVNTVILLNNALYLGSNIGQTIGDVSSLILNSLGIKNSEGQSIDVNEVIGNSIQNWIINKIGQANFSELEDKINKSNRSVRGISNLYSGVRSMMASTQDIVEETGIDVAKIGNGLRDSAAVEADSYGHMSEQPRKFNKLFTGLEKAEYFTDSFYSVTQNVQDL